MHQADETKLEWGDVTLNPRNYQPVIIIGAARSGTKFLRDLLAQAPCAACVPYDINYVWRYENAGRADDEFSAADCTPKIRMFITQTIPAIARFDPTVHTAIVEKTVSNCLRIPFVEQVLPDAKYVVLVRDGRAVTESAMRMWREKPQWAGIVEKLKTMPLRNYSYVAWFAGNYVSGLLKGRQGGEVWGPRYKGILDDVASEPLAFVCARQWSRSVDAAEAALAAIPESRRFTIRYEDLVSGPKALAELVDWLGWKDGASVLAAYGGRVTRDFDAQWRRLMSDADKAAMFRAAGDTLARLGYTD